MSSDRAGIRWSLKVGQLAGTVIDVHVTFFILLAWIGVSGAWRKLDGKVVGLLTRRDLVRWISEGGADRTAGAVMHRMFEAVEGSEPLDAVFSRLSQEPYKTLLVTDHGRLVGLVGLDEIANLLRIRRTVARRRHQAMGAAPSPVRRTGTHT